MTASRQTNMIKHRARSANSMAGKHVKGRSSSAAVADAEAYRQEYIDFINRLMYRMRMDGINRMLDKALEIVE